MEPVEQKMIETASMLLAMQTDIQVAGLSASGSVNMHKNSTMKRKSTAHHQHSMGKMLMDELHKMED